MPKQKQFAQFSKSDRKESLETMDRLRLDADRIAEAFKLKFRELRAERGDAVGHYGICYDDGRIRIRLRHVRSGRLLRYSSLVNTLCHELAHLRYFDHSDEFKRFYFELLRWARQHGIYQPRVPEALGPRKAPQVRQMRLL